MKIYIIPTYYIGKRSIGVFNMRLNHECVRALLLYFEENLKVGSHGLPGGIKIKFIDKDKYFPDFTYEEIYYTIDQLVNAKYIKARKNDIAPRSMIIDEITWKGHEFIDAARNDTIWKKTTNYVKTKGEGITVEILKQLLIQFAKNMLLEG